MVARASIISESEVYITVLCLIKNCSKGMSVITVATMKNMMVTCAPVIIWNWSLLCQLSLTRYTEVRIEKCSKITSVIKVGTIKYTNNFSLCKGSHHVQFPNSRFSMSAKMNGTQRRILASSWRMHSTYCNVQKGTSQAEATSEQSKNQALALAIIKLHWSEGNRHS